MLLHGIHDALAAGADVGVGARVVQQGEDGGAAIVAKHGAIAGG